jgi:hypothetical protein
MLAALYGRADAVRRLIEQGADLEIRNRDNKTALDLAEVYDNHNPREQPVAPRMREWIEARSWRLFGQLAAAIGNAMGNIFPRELLALMATYAIRLPQVAVKSDT